MRNPQLVWSHIVSTVANDETDIAQSLCAGSITSFSLYAPYFQSDLHYTQLRINGVSIVAEVAMYLPVPFLGYLCDRYSPPPLSFMGSVFFGFGYLLAAFTFRSGPPKDTGHGNGWPFAIMVISFIGVGMGTSATYLSAVATCAKNFGKSKHAGLVLAFPIAAFGLSGMWQSQIGEHLLNRKGPNGEPSNELDVFRYFVFLGCLLIAVGLLGTFGLQIVGEEDLIDERVEELERSGFLEESEFFRPRASRQNTNHGSRTYGTLESGQNEEDGEPEGDVESEADLTESMLLRKQIEAEAREEERRKKNWLLNLETRQFLSDPTMWFLAASFFLLTGPGEAYINNLGTIIKTLTPSSWTSSSPPAGAASTHVSTIAVTSTLARLLTGALSDLAAPRASSTKRPSSATPSSETPTEEVRGMSRLYLLVCSSFMLLLCFISVAVIVPSNPKVFPFSSALLGMGYGASFSLVPIVISVVWGVENFATNWGVVALMPAGGAAVWSAVYAVGYGNATLDDSDQCYGSKCFIGWAWGCVGSVALAMVLLMGAWRGWKKRGVIV